MNTTLTIGGFPYIEEEESKKIITFSSSARRIITNIPNAVISIILFPFIILLFVPLVNFLLWRLNSKLRKELAELKTDIPELSYENAKQGYVLLSNLVQLMEAINKEIQTASSNLLTRGINNKFKSITASFKEMRENLAQSLFINTENLEPLTDKEKKAFKNLNEIWGNDDDQEYARHTHYHLTQNMRGHGV